ncbi:hypothetical protein DV532_19890 [Pseudomonas sp. Leaf58]|uniref:hypothetical protein n=1 Tax=Pseudomonas sp. Leaf58 TaxID=1736226 RepID=UPI0009E75AF4|nr:hypothetical protein [Pseudomonas sp. Leaf58]AYG46425.1 hypothetical protein DV532_19890 [Pseudomonas sp. Leaf58]
MPEHHVIPGGYDPTFGEFGRAELPTFTAPFAGRNLTGIMRQGNKILVSALAFDEKQGRHFALTRFIGNGSVDKTFAQDGVIVGRYVTDEQASTEALTVLADQRFAMLGWSANNSNFLAKPRLTWYDQDGGATQTQVLPVPADTGIVIGSGRLASNGPYLMVSLNLHRTQGAPSAMARVYLLEHSAQPIPGLPEFIDILPGTGQIDVANIVQLPDGFVVGGTRSQQAQAAEGFIARYRHDGALDTSFGDGGTVFFRAEGFATEVSTLLRRPEGQLLIAGNATSGEGVPQALLWQFDASGTKDPTFNGGEPVLDDSGMTAWRAVTVDEQRRLFAFGVGRILEYRRYLADGRPDAGFQPSNDLIGIIDAMTCLDDGGRTVIGFNSGAVVGYIGTLMSIFN